jgi:hypothetical protein
MKGEGQDSQYWEDEHDYEENSDETEVETIDSEPEDSTNTERITEDSTVDSTEDIRAKLTAEAKRTGVMQAAPGTEQGKTGWYIDSTGELTSWLVSDSGEWTRMS